MAEKLNELITLGKRTEMEWLVGQKSTRLLLKYLFFPRAIKKYFGTDTRMTLECIRTVKIKPTIG